MKKNIFITGAAGFIGFHLAKHLHERGDKVIGFDNFNDYYSPQLKRDRANELQKHGISIIEGDICDRPLLQESIQKHKTTHIVHLAAQAGVRYSLHHPQAYIQSNIDGFLSILETCRANPGIGLVYASSSSVYGNNSKIPFSTEDRTDHQASLYGVTKKTNELMAQTYNHLFGIKNVGLRFFTVYGPWGRPDMAYYSFTKAIMEGTPIEIYNNGALQRDFTYIDDIVEGTTAAIDFKSNCEVFNLGNHRPVELMEFISLIEQFAGKKAIKKNLPMQKGDVLKTYADITSSKDQLNFLPKTELKVGLKKFVDWYQTYH